MIGHSSRYWNGCLFATLVPAYSGTRTTAAESLCGLGLYAKTHELEFSGLDYILKYITRTITGFSGLRYYGRGVTPCATQQKSSVY